MGEVVLCVPGELCPWSLGLAQLKSAWLRQLVNCLFSADGDGAVAEYKLQGTNCQLLKLNMVLIS